MFFSFSFQQYPVKDLPVKAAHVQMKHLVLQAH